MNSQLNAITALLKIEQLQNYSCYLLEKEYCNAAGNFEVNYIFEVLLINLARLIFIDYNVVPRCFSVRKQKVTVRTTE